MNIRVPITSTDTRLAESAARLRFAIVRTARRLRQEAAGAGGTELSPTAASTLATVERHGPLTPSELAEIERVKRPTATRTLRLLERGGPGRAHARPDRRPQLPGQRHRRRPRAPAPPARPQERLPGAPHARSSRRRRRDPGARRRDPRGDPGGAAAARAVSAAVRRSFDSLSVPNYRRYFAGQMVSLSGNWMQTVAAIWLILTLTDSGVAVGLTTALQFLPMLLFGAWGGLLADRFPKRRLLIATQALMAIPAVGLFAVTATGVVAPWMVYLAVFAMGLGQRGRQPDPAELRDRDGRPGPGRQRGQPQQRHRPVGADRRPGDRRAADRRLRGRPLLRPQRAHLRRDDLRPLGDGPARPAHRAGRPARAGRDPGRPALRPRHAGAGGAAGADGAGRHPRLQLPGGPAAARQLQLRRRRQRPTRRWSPRWRSARSPAPWSPAPTAAPARA